MDIAAMKAAEEARIEFQRSMRESDIYAREKLARIYRNAFNKGKK